MKSQKTPSFYIIIMGDVGHLLYKKSNPRQQFPQEKAIIYPIRHTEIPCMLYLVYT